MKKSSSISYEELDSLFANREWIFQDYYSRCHPSVTEEWAREHHRHWWDPEFKDDEPY